MTGRFERRSPVTAFGKWIQDQIVENRLTKAQLARELGCEISTLYRWMKKERDVESKLRIEAAIRRLGDRSGKTPPSAADDVPTDPLLEQVLTELSAALTSPTSVFDATGKRSVGWIPVSQAAGWVTCLQTVYQRVRERERLFRLIERNIHDVIWTTDLDLRFTYHSTSVERLRNVTPDAANRMTIEETLDEESAGRVRALHQGFRGALARHREDPARHPLPAEPLKLEVRNKRAGQTPIWVELSVNLLRDMRGEPTGIVGISRSIQERKDYEEKLVEVLNKVDLPVAFVTAEYAFQAVNPAFTRALGYTLDSLAGKTFVDITTDEDKNESRRRFELLLAGENPYPYLKHYVSADGRVVEAEVTAVRTPEASSTLPPVICMISPVG